MLENLMFSLNRVAPFFLLIILGQLLRRRGVLSEAFFKGANSFVFRMALPANMFLSLCRLDGGAGINARLLLFVGAATICSFGISWIIGMAAFRKRREWIGSFAQGAARGNYAVLGLPLILAIAGDSAGVTASLIVAVVIPLYSVISTIVLTIYSEDAASGGIHTILKSLAANPLLHGVFWGLLFGIFRIPLPQIFSQTAAYLSQCVTAMGLLSVGGIFEWQVARERMSPALLATFLKVLAFPVLATAAAHAAGFRNDELFMVFMVFVTPSAISSYPMAVELGADAPLAANILIMTTLAASLVIAVGIYVMRGLGWVA